MYASSLRGLIKGILINQALRAPEFLRDPIPQSGSEVNKFAQAVGRRVCDKYARSPSVDQVIFSPVYGWLCDPYLNNQGQGPTTPGTFLPVSSRDGGQCTDKQYKSYLKVQTYTINQQTGAVTWAPIAEVFSDPSLPGYGNLVGPVRLDFDKSGGSQTYIWRGKNNTSGANAGFGATPQYGGIILLDAWVQRVDGQLDNCGTPNGYTPPTFPTLPTLPPPTVIPPGSNAPNWDVNINPDGTIQFCIAGNCGNIPAPRPDGPPSAPSESPGTPDGSPTSTNPSTGIASGSTSSGRVLTGIKLTFTSTPVSATTLSGEFFRAPAWVGFGPSSTEIDFVTDGTWLRSGQFVMPDSENCTNWYVKANSGFVISVQPYSRLKAD